MSFSSLPGRQTWEALGVERTAVADAVQLAARRHRRLTLRLNVALAVPIARLLWLLLCLIAGGPCGFLALEGLTIPLVVLAFAAVITIGWRRRILPETLLAFGLCYAAVVLWFALPDAAYSTDMGGRSYFIAQATVSLAMPLAGLALLLGALPRSYLRR